MGESSQALYLPPGGRGTAGERWKENAIDLLCVFRARFGRRVMVYGFPIILPNTFLIEILNELAPFSLFKNKNRADRRSLCRFCSTLSSFPRQASN